MVVGEHEETGFLTFAGGQLAFQLVVPVSLGRQRRLRFFFIKDIQAVFGLRGGYSGVLKAPGTGGGTADEIEKSMC